MANLSRTDFFTILASITSAYPAPIYKNGFAVQPQLNTFAVITQPADLNSDNFGKSQTYLNQPYFFQRAQLNKVSIDYPAALILQFDGVLDATTGQNKADFQLLFLDIGAVSINTTVTNAQTSNVLASRTEEQIIADLDTIAISFMQALQTFVYAKVTYPSSSQSSFWAARPYLEQLQAAGAITEFQELDYMQTRILNSENVRTGIKLNARDVAATQTVGLVLDFTVLLSNCVDISGFNYKPLVKNPNPNIC